MKKSYSMRCVPAVSFHPYAFEYLSIRIDPMWNQHKAVPKPIIKKQNPPKSIQTMSISKPLFHTKPVDKKLNRIDLYKIKISRTRQFSEFIPCNARKYPLKPNPYWTIVSKPDRPHTTIGSRRESPYQRPKTSQSKFKTVHVFMPISPTVLHTIVI